MQNNWFHNNVKWNIWLNINYLQASAVLLEYFLLTDSFCVFAGSRWWRAHKRGTDRPVVQSQAEVWGEHQAEAYDPRWVTEKK